MGSVLVAMIPGIAAQIWQFGTGVVIQLAVAMLTAEAAEALALWARGRPIKPFLLDGSAALTGALLAVSLPALLPWPLTVFGALFAILIGKQIYGGLGYNPFNPAMVGYAVLLVSFPNTMSTWPPAGTPVSLGDAWSVIVGPDLPGRIRHDALAMATPLDTLKFRVTVPEVPSESLSAGGLGGVAGNGWVWVNLSYMLGGVWLLRRKLIAWQIPAGFLGTLVLASLASHVLEPVKYPAPWFHLLSGATMLGAFFIATDPVSAPSTPKGRLIYGASIGFLVFVIRAFGGYPDGVAFAVLLLNLAAPTLDHFTRPRVCDHPL